MSKTVVELLKQARETLSDPRRWIKGQFAKTAKRGKTAHVHAANAQCFCAVGALMLHSSGNFDARLKAEDALLDVANTMSRGYVTSVPDFNDAPHRRHSDIVRLFDATIAELEGEAA